jgi:hypothetical protein
MYPSLARATCRGALVAALLGLPKCAAAGTQDCLFALDGKRLEAAVRESGFRDTCFARRGKAGTKLFLTGRAADGKTLVEIISNAGVQSKRFAARRLELDDDGQPVCWVTNHSALAFARGELIPIVFTNELPATFGFSPGAEYFFLNQAGMLAGWRTANQPTLFLAPRVKSIAGYSPRWSAVFRSAEPTKPLFRLPEDFSVRLLFARKDGLYIFGYKFVLGAASRVVGEEAWGLVFSNDGAAYRLVNQLDLSKFGGVLDMGPVSGKLLVVDKRDFLGTWGVFDPKTLEYRSLGLRKPYGFFLEPDFCRYLEGKWK